MTKNEITVLFEKHDNHLKKMAWKCSRLSGHQSFEDCYSQACYSFMQATEMFDSARGNFKTFMPRAVWTRLIEWSLKNPAPIDPDEIPDFPAPSFRRPDKMLMRKEWLAELSEEAREIAHILLHGPEEIMDMAISSKKELKGQVVRYLRSQGWTFTKIWKARAELKRALKTIV